MAAASAHDDAETETPQEVPALHPFFDHWSRTTDGVARVHAAWTPEDTWLLDEHRTAAGDALLPGAAHLELARAALGELGVTRPFELRDLTFLRPLAVADGEVGEAEVRLTPTDEGYRFEVRQRVVIESTTAEDGPSGGRSGWRLTAEAALLLHELEPPAPLDLAAEVAATPELMATRTRQQDHLRFGPRWDVVQRVLQGDGRSLAWLRLAERFTADLDDVGLHPAMVDLGTGFAMGLVEGYTGDRLWVPVSYPRVRVFDGLPSEVIAKAVVHPDSSEANGFATFDVTLCDTDGRVLVEATGFTIKRLDGDLDLGLGRRVLPTEVELDAPPAQVRQRTLSELAFQHNLSQGILPAEGQRVFTRAIAADLPVVYVSSMDLVALREQSERIAATQVADSSRDTSAVFSRPALDSEFVAPRNDIEESLVAMWQELLGIDQVGVQDNFFDLGGHSLIAVRLFAQVKRTFSVEFPISILFEAPTIEACADLIAAAIPSTEAGADPSSTVIVPSARYRHLVAMHPGEGTSATPFFLVAGMFGNVLNLRHLAHQIGADRPFYGVQARGLYGDDAPHEHFEEMARDYLEEVRSVQPHGPYLLGGFSGGGLAAYEMAQQLLAAGEEVALLVLLDTPLPYNPPLTVRDRAKIQTDRLRERGLGYVKEWAVNRVAWERERRRRAGDPEVPAEEGTLHSQVVEAAFYRALDHYDLRPYPGVITLFRPKLTPLHVLGPDRQINVDRRFLYHDNGWAPHCRRVDVTEVPGDHDSMVLEPSVRVLAAHLRRVIEETAGAPRDPATGLARDLG
jgi:thioesterase domain-containing protein/acyl carrier protein